MSDPTVPGDSADQTPRPDSPGPVWPSPAPPSPVPPSPVPPSPPLAGPLPASPPTPRYGQYAPVPPQYGQPPYGQPQYGQPQGGPPQYGPQYGQSPYGQPQTGQPQYGQPQTGQPPYTQPPYGQTYSPYAQQWGAAPLPPVVDRPGTIPLRPLRLGDIFDGAFRSVRFSPGVMFGLSAIVAVIVGVATTVPLGLLDLGSMGDFLASSTYGQASAAAAARTAESIRNTMIGFGVSLLVTLLVSQILYGLLTHAVAQGTIGRKVTPGQAWRAVRSVVPSLVGLSFLLTIISGLAAALVMTPFALIAFSLNNSALGAIGLILLGALAAIIFGFWLTVRLLFATVCLVLERQGIWAALKRSWILTRRSFWRKAGTYLLTMILVSVASSIVAVPFSAVGAVFILSAPILYTVCIALATIVSQALLVPFQSAVVALLYIDTRIREEALDLALAQAAAERP